MSKYKLIFFPYRGRGELVRLTFAAAGETYEEQIITKQEWPSFKSKMPTGQLPVLEVDGKQLSQSLAIVRYLGREFGLAGKGNLEQCLVDQVIDEAADGFKQYLLYHNETVEDKKLEIKTSLIKDKIPQFVAVFKTLLEKYGDKNGYFVGPSLTLADLACHELFTHFLRLSPDALKDFPTLAGGATTERLPMCVDDTVSYVTDAGCRKVWRCVGGQLSNEPVFTCGQNLVFSEALGMCVWQGKEHDDCSSSRVTLDQPSVPPDHNGRVRCSDGSTAVPHESECQLYYDCTIQTTSNDTGVEPDDGVLRECEYPKLFSNVTKQCENFMNVDCGDRREHFDTCDYQRSNECHSSVICSPCAEQYPSCKGQPNGPHADVASFNRSSFVVCFNDRLVARKNCENDRFGERMVFYENGGLGTSGSCWSIYDIPQNDGGLLPNCPKGVFFKVFPDERGACDRFYECMYGMAFVRRCPGDLVYDSQAGVCSTREYACTPCGSRICNI